MERAQVGHVRRIGCCAAAALAALWSAAAGAAELPTAGAGPVSAPFSLSPLPPVATAVSGSRAGQVTGNWWGARDRLESNGVTIFADLTQYYQGVAAGGVEQQFEYGGRGDYLVDFDSQRLGLWEGGHLDLRGETRLGQSANQLDGAISPSNFAMALPTPNGNLTALTGVQLTHDVSENVSVFGGKLNLLDGTPARYQQGKRLRYFWNAAMQTNITRIYLLPSVLGCGLTVRDEGEPVFNFFLLDTHYTPTTSGFDTLFSNGVVAYGEYSLRTNWFDLPGHSAVGFLYSDATRTALDTNPYLLLAAILSGTPAPQVHSAWTATYRFDQVLYVDPQDETRQWTLSGDYGISDGNPNPVRWFGNVTLVGTSPLRSRANDTLGLGYYHLGMSSLPVLKLHHVGAENGFELFYNAAVRPWFHITPDFQVLCPAQQLTSTAILVGIRAQLTL